MALRSLTPGRSQRRNVALTAAWVVCTVLLTTPSATASMYLPPEGHGLPYADTDWTRWVVPTVLYHSQHVEEEVTGSDLRLNVSVAPPDPDDVNVTRPPDPDTVGGDWSVRAGSCIESTGRKACARLDPRDPVPVNVTAPAMPAPDSTGRQDTTGATGPWITSMEENRTRGNTTVSTMGDAPVDGKSTLEVVAWPHLDDGSRAAVEGCVEIEDKRRCQNAEAILPPTFDPGRDVAQPDAFLSQSGETAATGRTTAPGGHLAVGATSGDAVTSRNPQAPILADRMAPATPTEEAATALRQDLGDLPWHDLATAVAAIVMLPALLLPLAVKKWLSLVGLRSMEPRDACAHRVRQAILHQLIDRQPLSRQDLAATTGKSVSTIRFHLRILEEAGLVQQFGGTGSYVNYTLNHGSAAFRMEKGASSRNALKLLTRPWHRAIYDVVCSVGAIDTQALLRRLQENGGPVPHRSNVSRYATQLCEAGLIVRERYGGRAVWRPQERLPEMRRHMLRAFVLMLGVDGTLVRMQIDEDLSRWDRRSLRLLISLGLAEKQKDDITLTSRGEMVAAAVKLRPASRATSAAVQAIAA